MTLRRGEAAEKWARDHSERNPSTGGSWRGLCLSFVRQSFGVEARIPTAGQSWDASRHKHVVRSGAQIPAHVPVHFEMPTVADHVALSIGGGLCLSSDAVRTGKVDVISIDRLARKWGVSRIGWTEDMNGVRIWSPRKPKPRATNVSLARQDMRTAIDRLDRALKKNGRGDEVRQMRQALAKALNEGPRR